MFKFLSINENIDDKCKFYLYDYIIIRKKTVSQELTWRRLLSKEKTLPYFQNILFAIEERKKKRYYDLS